MRDSWQDPSLSAPRRSRGLLPVLLLGLSLLLPAASATARPEPTPMRLADTGLMVDRPGDWWPGGTVGYGVLVSLIGRGEGFPNFSVMTDPEWERDSEVTDRQIDRYLEDLFGALLEGQRDATVHEAGWERVNGLRVHSSVTSWNSVTGRLRARRLLLLHGGTPLILTWIERDDAYDAIGELIDRCAGSLRPAEREGTIG